MIQKACVLTLLEATSVFVLMDTLEMAFRVVVGICSYPFITTIIIGMCLTDINECEDGVLQVVVKKRTALTLKGATFVSVHMDSLEMDFSVSVGISCYHKASRNISVTDIDECANERPCHSNAECTNTPGSHTCQCMTGFLGDGTTCEG